MGLFNWGKKKCKHDYEVIEVSDKYFRSTYTGTFFIRDPNCEDYFIFPKVKNKICLKCGHCVDEIKKAKKEEMEAKREERRRKALAKQMWQDLNCDWKG